MERITTAEAARRLGISASGVRRRIKAGQLVAEVERRPQGTRLLVLWDASALAYPGASVGQLDANTNGASTRTDADKDALIAWLQLQLEESQRGQAELRRMLNLEQQTVAALREALTASRALGTPTSTPTRTAPRCRSLWWVRVWRALRG